MQELFLSNTSMAMAILALPWLGMDLFFVVWVFRYRTKCRQVVAEGEPLPVPWRWGARLRGICPPVEEVLVVVLVLCLLLSVGEGQTSYIDSYSAYTREQDSTAAASFEYCRYDQEEGDLRMERTDCRADQLAEWIYEDFRATEGDEKRLQRELHRHRPAVPRAVELGFNRVRSYSSGEYKGLILRNGNQVLHIEGNQIDLTGAKTLADIHAWLAKGAQGSIFIGPRVGEGTCPYRGANPAAVLRYAAGEARAATRNAPMGRMPDCDVGSMPHTRKREE